jgi:hypothetical protein
MNFHCFFESLDDSPDIPLAFLLIVNINLVSDFKVPEVPDIFLIFSTFRSVSGPNVSKLHLNHEDITILQNKLFESRLHLVQFNLSPHSSLLLEP